MGMFAGTFANVTRSLTLDTIQLRAFTETFSQRDDDGFQAALWCAGIWGRGVVGKQRHW